MPIVAKKKSSNMKFSRKDNVKKLGTLNNGDVFILHDDIKESSPQSLYESNH